MNICSYGCGKEAKYYFSNGKYCCSKHCNSCPSMKKPRSEKFKKEQSNRMKGENNHFYGKKHTEETRKKLGRKGEKNPFFGKHHNEETKRKISEKNKKIKPYIRTEKHRKIASNISKYTIEKLQNKYPLFFKIEEMRYNPDKPGEKEIQVHCKNHNCENSKEKGGWFTPNIGQLYRRLQAIEQQHGFEEHNFYCSDKCKQNCPLFNLKSDPFQQPKDKPYTEEEYQTFRKFVLERDNYICQFCGEKATDVHHERPQKLEPFFSLDPDYAWSCCENCHYEKGHKDDCSTGRLAKKIC